MNIQNPSSNKIRVLLVDDSVVVRGMLRQIINKYEEVEIVGAAPNGRAGVDHYKRLQPDVVIMDIEMPEMNGIEALAEILKIDDKAKVIMCSSLTQSGAAMTVKALETGAYDCLAKPTSDKIEQGQGFEDQLLLKLRSIKKIDYSKLNSKPSEDIKKIHVRRTSDFTLRPFPTLFGAGSPRALVIGCSTGGPRALTDVMPKINKNIDLPIFITQHMPKGFTRILAENIEKTSGFTTYEAEDGMLVKSNHVYVAPGGKHMTVEKQSAGMFIVITDTPPVNHCKPAVDVMVDSILKAYQTGIISVILTGMGEDGLASCRKTVEANEKNILIAQDEKTSVVWGMPGAVASSNICHAVLPLDDIGDAINTLARGGRV